MSADVVIVGARCAGAPLAALLARAGLDVVVLEKATFPRPIASTHLFEADGIAFLKRLGVLDELIAAQAPLIRRADMRIGDTRLDLRWPLEPHDVAGITSVRREVLDPILANAARDAGADVRFGVTVTDLLPTGGVRTDQGDVAARLVIGADGRASTIAKLAGARRYNLVPNERAIYWGYFEGADHGPEPTFVFHRWGNRAHVASPTDGGLYCSQVMIDLAEVDAFKRDIEASFMERCATCEPVAKALHGARLVGKIQGQLKWEGFFREATGPGWVLTGDAGHFKDPAPGRGIADAFLQADFLAAHLIKGDFDQATAKFARWRDKEFAEYYWFGSDQGAGGELPAVVPEFVSRLKEPAELLAITNHRKRPREVLKPPRLLAAAARAARKGDTRKVLGEVAQQARLDAKRGRLNKRPRYE
jgi:flavin-dependent dehydrogenase